MVQQITIPDDLTDGFDLIDPRPYGEAGHPHGSLAALRRRDEAEDEARRAHELDPLCFVVGASGAWVSYLAGDYDTAIVSRMR